MRLGRLLRKHRFYTFDNFQAHPAIVVGALPEAGVVIVEVYTAVLADAPVPFAMLVVDESVLDVAPQS